LSMGIRSDWPLFVGILQKALDAIPETRKNEIYKKWISVKYEHGFDYSLLWKILIPSLIVLSLVIYWNRRLSQEIELRTIADTELVKARDAAEAANRAKSVFLASMSHELRTPLNSIMGFNSILLMEMAGPLNFEQKKQLKIVKGSSQHLLNLINDILDISKIEAGEFKLSYEEFNLEKLINEVIEILKPLAEKKGLELNAIIDESTGVIKSDKRRLNQVLINLLNNAVKFTNRGGVTLSVRKEGDKLEIKVKDTGIGIDEESISELFQPFHQLDTGTNRVFEGTGLGLSICRRIIEMMGGKIWVESQPGVGSTFGFIIPVVREEVNEEE
jgi:signal transduction histidine kinase